MNTEKWIIGFILSMCFILFGGISVVTAMESMQFFERTWLFIHGLAVCIATKYIPCQDERYLISMVKEAYNAAVKMMNLEGVLKLQEI